MLSPLIKKKIEAKYGAHIRYPKDCDALASNISKTCKCQISGSTIKRLFGLIKGTETPRMWTLDLIGFYLGYNSWDDLINDISENKPNTTNRIEFILSKGLKKGKLLKISCGKTASVSIEHLGKGLFTVIEQNKTVLSKFDVLEIEKIRLHFPLLIKKVKRGNVILDGVLIGSITGVTNISEMETSTRIISSDRIHINSTN